LRGALEREDAAIGIFITLEPPTSEMMKEAISCGFYESPLWMNKYPRIQILTIEDLLKGTEVKMPAAYSAFKRAEKVIKEEGKQKEFVSVQLVISTALSKIKTPAVLIKKIEFG
jgi:site-specific DNA-methyltransferase (adenine-specific)